jgi:hypothetical protein
MITGIHKSGDMKKRYRGQEQKHVEYEAAYCGITTL